jgi:FkbM family methyltransferase
MIRQLLGSEQRSAIERWCQSRAMAVPIAGGGTLARVLGEYKMVLYMSDLEIAPHLAIDGHWEIWNSMLLAKRVKPGWRVIDVGANIGYFTMLLADLVGPSGSVEAWEPLGIYTSMLRISLEINGHRHVKLVGAAAGSAHATMQMEYVPGHMGSARIVPGGSVSVVVEPLDSVEGPVDFIKIDAEGYEPEIWAGMKQMLARGEPRCLLMEWTPWKYKDAAGFRAEIEKSGYRIGVVDAAGGVQAPAGDIAALTDGHLDLWLERA